MSRALHSRADLHAQIDSLPDRMVTDGVILYAPKTEARYRKSHPHKRFVIEADVDLIKGLEEERDRWITAFGGHKGMALSNMVAWLKRPTQEDLALWADRGNE